VFAANTPGTVDFFHVYVPAAAAQSAKMIYVKDSLSAGRVETHVRKSDESLIVREFLFELRRPVP
jgi:hypothetical protein